MEARQSAFAWCHGRSRFEDLGDRENKNITIETLLFSWDFGFEIR
jgi:hypothetical protein